ncbi:glucose-6-phosphate 1-dehydrogenase family protein [Avibacterium sp. 20-15]|uniref:glucose-6-phosphate 1-dehydrogenase family protein n=1 Tax=unclassified Avibacterium TaxID=2685287 RepID=UPI002025F812|nr:MULTISPECIES: glucose-6-phosphate 1-dehydrogenase family protein [unclassified Avibacterium]MCW9733400.1 glucose-6-phosphate 1-dehydrogenase family protein [Avibacterium sp. 20-15]URL03117.1 glucose-6-phosphate 1-dehydrogenase family protein [Avibacterium sp. 20-126]URL05479.1 glucose-6-phosphate 1-dehydrogenase family protein [Avibacterium sp. 20-132]
MITSASCDLFNLPFFQFAQMKKFCPEQIPQIKADYKRDWNLWKTAILRVAQQLGAPFAEPHIEKWCNGWQVRAHFFAYFKYEFNKNSAAILSVILNRRRLQVSLDWHCYRADRSQINVQQYNQWVEQLDQAQYADFDFWRGDESEYADFRKVRSLSAQDFLLNNDEDFFCIGKNIEKAELDHIDAVEFIVQTIQDLLPLYEKCHLKSI